jgi:CBS domain-containing protein
MRTNVPAATWDPHQQVVQRYVMGTDERAFPVVDGDRLVGLVTLEDIRRVARNDWDSTTAAES